MRAVERRIVEGDDVAQAAWHDRLRVRARPGVARRRDSAMMPLHQLLHRIRWDAAFGAARFVLGYYDRVAQRIVRVGLRELSFDPVNRAMLSFVDEDGAVHSLPLHRVKEVFRNDRLIWLREH